MTTPARTLPPLTEWQVFNLQLIVFPTDPAAALQRDWWEGAMHAPPEEERRKTIERTESGKFHDWILSVTTDLQKIAWTIAMEIPTDAPLEGLPTLGPYPDVRDRFVAIMDPWLAGEAPPLKRIGFAAALAQPAQDHAAAYQKLDEYLSVVKVDPRSTDFQYRVNRPTVTELGLPGLTINRLETWSALKMQTSYRAISPAGPPQPSVLQRDHYACAVHLDVNTSVDRQEPLPRELLPRLFGELVAKATEIAEQGDQP